MKSRSSVVAGLVDRDDVRMVDRRGQLRLAQEAVTERFVLGEAGSEQLECNSPPESQIHGQVDDAHPTPAEQRFDQITGEFGADPRVVAHNHVLILAFVASPERYDDSQRCVTNPHFSDVSGVQRRSRGLTRRVGTESQLARCGWRTAGAQGRLSRARNFTERIRRRAAASIAARLTRRCTGETDAATSRG